MAQETVTNGTEALFTREGKPPVQEMIPCALQHVLASFAGIITPAGQTKENRDGAADDLAAQQRAKAKARGTHGLQGREERERNAHDDGQATANATERSEDTI